MPKDISAWVIIVSLFKFKEFSMSDLQNEFEDALLSLDRITVKEIISAKCEQIGATAVIEEIIVPALEQIGDGWKFGGGCGCNGVEAGGWDGGGGGCR